MNQCDICEEMGCKDCENCSLGNPCYDCEDYDRITKSCTSNGGCADMRVDDTPYKSYVCSLVKFRGKAQGHEFDYQYCAYGARKE